MFPKQHKLRTNSGRRLEHQSGRQTKDRAATAQSNGLLILAADEEFHVILSLVV